MPGSDSDTGKDICPNCRSQFSKIKRQLRKTFTYKLKCNSCGYIYFVEK